MKQTDQQFNQDAACLRPSDMPPNFGDPVESKTETCIFTLPDFRDAVDPKNGNNSIHLDQPLTFIAKTAKKSDRPSEVKPKPAVAAPLKQESASGLTAATGKSVALAVTQETKATETCRSPLPALPANQLVAFPEMAGIDPSQLDDLFQRVDLSIFEQYSGNESSPEGRRQALEPVPLNESHGESHGEVRPEDQPEFHEVLASEDQNNEETSSVQGESVSAKTTQKLPETNSVKTDQSETEYLTTQNLPDQAAFASAVARVTVEREYAKISDSETGQNRVLLSAQANAIRMDCEGLIKTVVQRSGENLAGVFLFCDVDSPLRSGKTAATVARELAISTGKRVLMVDSDLEFGTLTKQMGLQKIPGTREMLRAMHPWTRLVAATDVDNVDFLACGTQKLRFTGPSSFVESVWRKTIAEMSEHYGFVLIATGTAFDNSLKLWCTLCDGTCLILDAENSSRSISQAAVRELNTAGCRVLGCVPVMNSPRSAATAPKRKAA